MAHRYKNDQKPIKNVEKSVLHLLEDIEIDDQITRTIKKTNLPFINDYIKNTVGPKHGYKLEVMEMFNISHHKPNPSFRLDLKRRLLWHGTQKENIYNILRNGLDLNRAEANSMFGPGYYFTDCVTKAARYSCAYGNQPDEIRDAIVQANGNVTGYLLLCDVSVGKMRHYKKNDYHANLLLDGEDSVWGKGKYSSEKGSNKYSKGVMICPGPLKKQFHSNELDYNEFVVYSNDKIHLRYLVKVKYVLSDSQPIQASIRYRSLISQRLRLQTPKDQPIQYGLSYFSKTSSSDLPKIIERVIRNFLAWWRNLKFNSNTFIAIVLSMILLLLGVLLCRPYQITNNHHNNQAYHENKQYRTQFAFSGWFLNYQ